MLIRPMDKVQSTTRFAGELPADQAVGSNSGIYLTIATNGKRQDVANDRVACFDSACPWTDQSDIKKGVRSLLSRKLKIGPRMKYQADLDNPKSFAGLLLQF